MDVEELTLPLRLSDLQQGFQTGETLQGEPQVLLTTGLRELLTKTHFDDLGTSSLDVCHTDVNIRLTKTRKHRLQAKNQPQKYLT